MKKVFVLALSLFSIPAFAGQYECMVSTDSGITQTDSSGLVYLKDQIIVNSAVVTENKVYQLFASENPLAYSNAGILLQIADHQADPSDPTDRSFTDTISLKAVFLEDISLFNPDEAVDLKKHSYFTVTAAKNSPVIFSDTRIEGRYTIVFCQRQD